MNNLLLELSFSQEQSMSDSLLDFAFSQTANWQGSLLDFAFSGQQAADKHLLDLSFSNVSGSLKRRFNGSQTIDFADFDVIVHIGGLPVPMCDLARSMTIERGENQSAILDFVMRPAACREINLFAWYGKRITVDVQSNQETVRLFTGFVDKNVPDLLSGFASLRCSERREQMINSLLKSTIKSIGYVLDGEKYNTQKEELDARLNTVPASFEISPRGAISLTPWLPKATPDKVMRRCNIYQRNFTLELNEIGGMTNVVNASVVVDYPRLLQRSVFFMFINGLNVCDYSRYKQLPDVNEFQAAIEQAGWELGGFDCERIEKSGIYNCGGAPLMHYREPAQITENNAESGAESGAESEDSGDITVTRMRNLDIKSGTFEMVNRWNQSIRHEFVLRVQAPESIAIFGENKANASYSVSQDLNIEWGQLGWHDKQLRYHLDNNRINFLPFAGNLEPRLDKQRFTLSPKGDWFCDVLPENNAVRQALNVAYHAAYTQILKAHRQTVSLECKFMPHVDLTQTHAIEHSQFLGSAKVSKITHIFDFEKKLGHTALAYQFFYMRGKEQRQYSQFKEPAPQSPPTQPFNANLPPLVRVELNEDEELSDKHTGMIYRVATTSNGVKLFDALELVVATPEIEEKSTQTLEFKQDVTCDVALFDNKIIAHLC